MSDEKKENRQDSVSDLLESFEAEANLSKKMDSFAKVREEHIKIARERRKNLPQNEYVIEQDFEISEEIPKIPDDEMPTRRQDKIEPVAHPAITKTEGTQIFEHPQKIEAVNNTTSTRVMDHNEIETIIKTSQRPKMEAPALKKVEKHKDQQNARTLKIVLISVLGVVLACVMVFGFFTIIMPTLSNVTQTTTEGYDELYEWAKNYNSLSDEEKEKIADFEKIYNSLSDDQKDTINQLLKDATGKSFDALLAEYKSKDKDDSANNNTKIAEQKAKLKDEIAALQAQYDSLKAEYDQTVAKINAAYTDFLNAESSYQTAESNYTAAQSEVSSAESTYNYYVARQSELQAKAADNTITPEEQTELDSLSVQISNASAALTSAQASLESAASTLNSSASAYNSAADYYNSIRNDDADYQSQLDALQEQIDAKQAELDALDTKS